MKLFSRILFTLALAVLPLDASAAAPGSVTGIAAELQDQVVTVSWDGVAGASSYRIFYSHTSILENDGLYDDFETVSNATTHTLQNIPPATDLYISVLAVNATGEESPYFVEEAHVSLGAGFLQQSSSSVQSSAASSQPAVALPYGQNDVVVQDGETFLRLLSAESISGTGVLLTFSHPVVVAPEQATLAFGILTASGTPLSLQRLVIQGNTVRIDTDWQESIVYQVRLGPVVTGTDEHGAMLVLDPTQSPMLFVGRQTGSSTVTPPVTTPSTTRGDILSLRLRATTEADRSVTVEGAWTVADDIAITSYQVEQSLDGGATFSAPSNVPKESMGIRIPRVPAGTFTLRVTAVYSDNSTSPGKTETVTIAGGSTLGGTVTGYKPTSPLSSSGPGLWLTVTLSGACAGFWMARRRMVQA